MVQKLIKIGKWGDYELVEIFKKLIRHDIKFSYIEKSLLNLKSWKKVIEDIFFYSVVESWLLHCLWLYKLNQDYGLQALENSRSIRVLIWNLPLEIGLEEKLYLIYMINFIELKDGLLYIQQI